MFKDIFSVEQSLSQLRALPAQYSQAAHDGEGKGWFMHLQPVRQGGYKAYPGVYSTSFAIQLLTADRKIAKQSSALIVDGLDYLARQFQDAEAVDNGASSDCKQSHKVADVGHHDFVLTFKLCAVLQAANSIATIVDSHEGFGRVLARHDDCLNRMAERLKSFAVTEQQGSTVRRAWPWHVLNGAAREVDPVPTAEVLLTLTHPSLKGSRRWLREYAEVAAYLQSLILPEDMALLLDRCVAAYALLRLSQRTTEDYLRTQDKAQLTDMISKTLREPANVPWQEVMHYSVPSNSNTLSHYKPWVWLFPRIHYVETLCLLDPSAAASLAAGAVTDLVTNIKEHQGRVIFAHAEPPALLACLKTAQLLSEVSSTVLRSLKGRLILGYQRTARALQPLRVLGFVIWSLILYATLYSCGGAFTSSVLDATAIQRSTHMLTEVVTRLYSVWPIWLIAFVYFMIQGNGSLRKRLGVAILMLVTVAVLGLLVNLLAR